MDNIFWGCFFSLEIIQKKLLTKTGDTIKNTLNYVYIGNIESDEQFLIQK